MSKRQVKRQRAGYLKTVIAVMFMASIVFLSTAIMLFIGLIPAFVAFFTDSSPKKSKAVTVGSYNLIGCMPFVMDLWSTDTSIDQAMNIVLDPITLIVMYAAAGFGYMVDWSMTSAMAAMIYKQGLERQKAIEKRQKKLVERWGDVVKKKKEE